MIPQKTIIVLAILIAVSGAAFVPSGSAGGSGTCGSGGHIAYLSTNSGQTPATKHSDGDLVPNVLEVHRTATNGLMSVTVWRQSTVAGSCTQAETLPVGIQGSGPIPQGVNEYVGLVITSNPSPAGFQILKTAT